MVNQTTITCPQCLNENPANSSKCELCDWPLSDDPGEATIMPKLAPDPDQTIAPEMMAGSLDRNETDPLQTVAPDQQFTDSHSIAEKHAFHLAGDLAHFEVLEIIGQGGMGAVYHAMDKTLQRDVALKLLRPLAFVSDASTDALLDEARMASKLNHPNIVTIYDVARADDSHYIVMEWVDGQPLAELIPESGMSLEQALGYACQIADGLVAAHKKYMIHRDIKPQNIMLTANGTIKILDFGIAGLVNPLDEGNEDHAQERPTSVVGTPSYMSPEQAQGFNLDQRSDIFSFGILLYEMLSGQRPFNGSGSAAITKAVCEGQYQPIQEVVADLPPQVVTLLDKMLAKQKDERWQSSAELADELHGIHHDLTHKKNWWQRQHWLTKAAVLIPFVLALGWSVKEILFPASTQELIEQQLAEATTVAILPFDNISGDPLLQMFGDGLAVNLSTDLTTVASEIGDTWIVPATEIARMKEVTPKTVADKYGVELILTGSMQHMGSTRLMVLNLLDAQSGQQLRTTELSINADDLFGGHALIREQAMELLEWPMSETLMTTFNAERPQLDGAYKQYVEGRGYLYRYDQEGNLEEAINAFKSALDLDESYENAQVGLAEAYLNQFTKTKDKDWLDKMVESIENLKIINKDNTLINYLSAEAEVNLGNYDQAIKLYQSSIADNPNNLDAQIGLANAFNKAGKSEFAEATYLEAMRIAPNNWNVIVNLGVFYAQTGEYEKALEQFQELIEISPNNHIGYRNVAGIYYIMNDIDNAIKFSEQAISIKPSDRAYSNLGTMYFSKGEYENAKNNYLKAIELNGNFYIHWGNLADNYKLIGDHQASFNAYKEAVKISREMLVINPNDTKVKVDLSYYLSNIKSDKEALKLASQINLDSTGLENFIIALTYDQLGKVDLAIQHLNWALDKKYPLEEIETTPFLENSKSTEDFKKLLLSRQ